MEVNLIIHVMAVKKPRPDHTTVISIFETGSKVFFVILFVFEYVILEQLVKSYFLKLLISKNDSLSLFLQLHLHFCNLFLIR